MNVTNTVTESNLDIIWIPNPNYLEVFGSIWFSTKPKVFGIQFGQIRTWAKTQEGYKRKKIRICNGPRSRSIDCRLVLLLDSNPNMCTPFWEKLQFVASKYRCYRVRTSENLTDLDRGRRPELKSVEFFKSISPCHEISSLLCDIVGERMLHLMGAGPVG